MRKDKDFKDDELWKDFLRYKDIFGIAMKIEMLTRYNADIYFYATDRRMRVDIYNILPASPYIEYLYYFEFDLSSKETADKIEEDLAMLLIRTLEKEGGLL